MPKDEHRLVYSTEKGYQGNQDDRRETRRGDKRKKKQAARDAAKSDPRDGVVRVRRETSGRGGKTVTTITGLPPVDVKPVSKALKQACGTGGAVKNGVVEIQGEHVDKIVAALEERGFTVKRAGG